MKQQAATARAKKSDPPQNNPSQATNQPLITDPFQILVESRHLDELKGFLLNPPRDSDGKSLLDGKAQQAIAQAILRIQLRLGIAPKWATTSPPAISFVTTA